MRGLRGAELPGVPLALAAQTNLARHTCANQPGSTYAGAVARGAVSIRIFGTPV
jgi:hypothetical protein